MIYLASPYSHPEAEIRQSRYEQVERLAAQYLMKGLTAFSPIVYGHNMAVAYDMGLAANDWWRFNAAILRRCEEVHVVQINGWETSIGIQQEIEFANTLHLPLTYVDKFGAVVRSFG